MKLTEIAFFTDDVQAMSAFYQTLLGKMPVAQSEGMSIFLIDQTKIFIHRTYNEDEGELLPENHLAFTVPDLDKACEDLKKADVAVEVEPKLYDWGRSAYLRDPDGQLIELNELNEAEGS